MKKLIIALVLPQLAGVIGSWFTLTAIDSWYQGLVKPLWSPPNWVFGPVWLSLYLMMGVSWFLAWKKGAPKALFLIHLAFNSLWSVLFFGFRQPGLALVEIVILWLLIVAVMRQFYKFNPVSAWLLLPYLFWVSFAAFLNFTIYRLN